MSCIESTLFSILRVQASPCIVSYSIILVLLYFLLYQLSTGEHTQKAQPLLGAYL